MTICERMFIEIHQKKLSQKQFAINIGSTEKTVSAWKNRNSDPPACLIPAIADALNITIDYLLTGNGEEKKTSTELNDKEQECLKIFKSLQPDDQLLAIGYMTGLAAKDTPESKENVS